MKLSYLYELDTWMISSLLFVLMLATIWAGRWFAKNRTHEYAENPGTAAVTASLYGLFGLLLAFTFAMSGERFKERKHIIVDEANAINTVRLRLRLYPDSVQAQFQKSFDQYLDARIDYYYGNADTLRIQKALQKTSVYAEALWDLAVQHSKINANLLASNQMLLALTQMNDFGNAQYRAEYNRTPPSILTMLFFLSISIAFVAGHTSKGKGLFDWWMAVGFCLLTSMVIFFIIDLDKPRRGVITLDQNIKAIIDLRNFRNP
jgi:hypothetical protein